MLKKQVELMRTKVIEVLEKYGTKRAHQAITSNTGYYDFMINSKRVHIRLSDHLKDTKEDDTHYDIQVIHGSGNTWILKYGKFLITREGDEFVKFLDSFLLVFPEVFEIIDNAVSQVTETIEIFSKTKTDYEELRKEFREYKEKFRKENELEAEIDSLKKVISGKNTVIENLESCIRSQKDRITALEMDNPDFRFLTDLKKMYGELLEELNEGLRKVKEFRKQYESKKML